MKKTILIKLIIYIFVIIANNKTNAQALSNNGINTILKKINTIQLEKHICKINSSDFSYYSLGTTVVHIWNNDSIIFFNFPLYYDKNEVNLKHQDSLLKMKIKNIDLFKKYALGKYGIINDGILHKNIFKISKSKKVNLDFDPDMIKTKYISNAFYYTNSGFYYLFLLCADENANGNGATHGYCYTYVFNQKNIQIYNFVYLYDYSIENSIGFFDNANLIEFVTYKDFTTSEEFDFCSRYILYAINPFQKKVEQLKFQATNDFNLIICTDSNENIIHTNIIK